MLDRTLDRINISQPCRADWESMIGNDQIRFCEHCDLHVNDLSRMTRSAALRLVTTSRGRLCVRYVRLPNGRISTSDVPARLHRIGRRASRIAAGAVTATISLSSASAQNRRPSANAEAHTDVELVETLRQRPLLVDEFTSSLAGTIRTSEGSIVSDASVILVDRESGQELTSVSSSLGTYEFQLVPEGDYLLWARKHGFMTASEQIHLRTNMRLRQDLELRERMRWGTMGAMAFRSQSPDPLVLAISEDDVEKVRTLVLADPNLNSPDRSEGDRSLLADAVQHGNREIVGILLAAGARVDIRTSSGRTGLMYLTDHASVELVRDLLGAGAKVNARDDLGESALMSAANFSSAAVLKELIAAGARVDATTQSGETALFFAAQGDNSDPVTLLLNYGAQVDARNDDDETPLISMAAHGTFENLKLLIERGANIQLSDAEGTTALMNAAANQDSRLANLLVEAGADVNAKDSLHNTALMTAAEEGRDATVKILARGGADLDATDGEGQTALMKAGAQGTLDCVRALLEAGADVTIKDKEGNTALALARENKHEDVVELLKLHGARE
jgi:ankyrin repeat protein